jgi:hypothetical protein
MAGIVLGVLGLLVLLIGLLGVVASQPEPGFGTAFGETPSGGTNTTIVDLALVRTISDADAHRATLRAEGSDRAVTAFVVPATTCIVTGR